MVEYNPDFESDVQLRKENGRYWTCFPQNRNSALRNWKGERYQEYPVCDKGLAGQGSYFVKEELKRTYKPKTETRVRLTEAASNERRLHFSLMNCSAVLPNSWIC